MKVIRYTDVKAEEVEEGAKGVRIRWIITESTGARNFVMRHFEIAPGGYTPHHAHAWEHEVFVLEGPAEVRTESTATPVSPGDAVLVMPDEQHQFRNTGQSPARFLCMIPLT